MKGICSTWSKGTPWLGTNMGEALGEITLLWIEWSEEKEIWAFLRGLNKNQEEAEHHTKSNQTINSLSSFSFHYKYGMIYNMCNKDKHVLQWSLSISSLLSLSSTVLSPTAVGQLCQWETPKSQKPKRESECWITFINLIKSTLPCNASYFSLFPSLSITLALFFPTLGFIKDANFELTKKKKKTIFDEPNSISPVFDLGFACFVI